MKKYIFLLLFFLFPLSAQAFSDLTETHRHYHSLSYLEWEGVIGGYSDGTVRPDNQINRAELVKILVEGLNKSTNSTHKNCFPDVKEEWYARYVCYALDNDWIAGYPDGTFKPSQNVNKAEALKIIMNAFEVKTADPRGDLFDDVDFGAWFAPFLQRAKDKNLIEESGRRFDPGDFRSRGEVAEMVARIKQMEYMGDLVYTDTIKAEFATFLYLQKLREQNGVTAKLKLNPYLTKTARLHSEDMAEVINDMSHASSDGVTQSYDRIKAEIRAYDDVNFDGRTGENVGRSYSSTAFGAVKNVHDNIFMPEPDVGCNHRTTILSTCLPFTEVGIGVYVKSDGQVYFTEDFISRFSTAKANYLSPQLEIPAEYSGSNVTVTEVAGDHVYTEIEGCDGDRVRVEDFMFTGVYFEGSKCVLWEFAFHYESNIMVSSMPHVYDDGVLDFYKGNGGLDIYGHGGWKIISPASFSNLSEGDTEIITIEKDGQTKRFELDFSQSGWVTVTKL